MHIILDREDLIYSCPFHSDVNSCKALNTGVNTCPTWHENEDIDEMVVCKNCPLLSTGVEVYLKPNLKD